MRRLLPLILVVLAAAGVTALVLALTLGGTRRHTTRAPLESIFQDDDHLLYSPTPVVERTLEELRQLGVDRLRLTILWRAIAPDPSATRRPAGFAARNPDAYPAGVWTPYDRIVQLARARGLKVDFNLTAPGPLWAMAQPSTSSRVADHERPDPREFEDFVAAVGRRYDGAFRAPGSASPLPRVSFWTVWNEPNQPGWLYPQWRVVLGRQAMDSPRLYRLYVDAAFRALARTGHTPASDSILIGELAPEGRSDAQGPTVPIPPLSFLRTLYCLDADYHPLRGEAAAAQHCPQSGPPQAFVAAHPGLFTATAFAHHPYSFFLPPNVSLPDPNFAPLSDLGRLESALDRTLASYGIHRQLPIYLTEYGYESNPPDPFRGVPLQRQAAYLALAQYLAWRDPRVRAMAQFLLPDAGPDRRYPPGSIGYWSTFQTGLEFADGRPKPSLASYRLPVVLDRSTVPPGGGVTVWALVRPARSGTQEVTVRWRGGRGPALALATVTRLPADRVLRVPVTPPGSGTITVTWQVPGGGAVSSAPVSVTVR